MATVTQVTLTCDVCGNAQDVKTWLFGLDGKAYEIDLCRKDGNALGGVAAGYIAKARKVTARHGHRRRGSRVRRQKGIYVYGILPDDIEVAAGIRGVGRRPGLLRDVRLDRLTALVSDVDLSGPLGSTDDRRTYREILDATAVETPVLPLPFGTVLASEDAVAEELLAAHYAEFTAALDQLEGRAEFRVKGRYVKDAVLGAVLSQNKQAARLRDAIQGQDRDAARNARTELGRLIHEAVTARREEDTRALRQAMDGVCVASVALELTHQLDAVRGAFLVALDRECEVERVVEDLAREWEGRIDVQLLGPMAAYDFTGPAQTEG